MKCQELSTKQLRFYCDESLFDFATTADVPEPHEMIGQERAVRAVQFGLYNKNPGYNIFMSGLVGTGKITYAKNAVQQSASKQSIPDDWCYVNNFENDSQPLALSLPPGIGTRFRKDMKDLVDNLKTDISKVFSSEDYESARKSLSKKFQEQRAALLDAFNEQAEQAGVMPQWSSTGFVGLPVVDGKPVTPEEYQKLDKEQKEGIEKKLLTVHDQAMEVVRRLQHIERDVREELKQLDEKVGLYAAGHLIEDLHETYAGNKTVAAYLEAVQRDIVKNINDFKPSSGEEENNPFAMFKRSPDVNQKYRVNVLVDNKETHGAPVVVEINPTYYNLIGRVEYETRMGVVHTDYTMIKPGALHRANGGYLILHARDILSNLGAWEALKRVLKTKKLPIENLGEQYGMLAMASLKPEPIDLDVKVILVGNPMLYHLLYSYDEDFGKLFKVHADFDTQMENNPMNVKKLAGFISSTVKRKSLKDFSRSAVARMVEYCSRLADSQTKLTTRFNEVVEVICEADAWANLDNSPLVTDQYIKQAIEEKRYRSNKYEEKLQEMFAEGKLLIDTEGKKVGQVNGLAVLAVGEYMFGKPSRITANTYMGKSGVINIERETKISGSSHTKGVLILSGYIGEKYAQQQPLVLTCSLTFEQLYEGVDGDSASSTELYAILSSLSGLPIRQEIAVTGSVNQKGEVQPIGGATQKIEGFFTVCKLKGLTGSQGVMIPYQNINNLALNDEVIEAVKTGKFHIYPIHTIDEGLEVLTGVPAGEIQFDGTYPRGTVHQLVSKKLNEYIEQFIKITKEDDDK